MQKTLIAAATEKEIAPLLVLMKPAGPDKAPEGPRSFLFRGIPVDVLITGVGMVSTTYHLVKALAKTRYGIALNLGLAGAFNRSLHLGEVLNVTEDRFAELGAEDGKAHLCLADIGLCFDPYFPDGVIQNRSIGEKVGIEQIKTVKGITVNRVHGDGESISRTLQHHTPDVESMEGAAFLYVCAMEKQKCLQLRAVSNYVEKRNREAWKTELAVEQLCKVVVSILKSMPDVSS